MCDALYITPEQLLTRKGIDPEYKDEDMDYEVTRADIKILKQIHSLGDEQYKRLMEYIKALQKLEQMESIVEDWLISSWNWKINLPELITGLVGGKMEYTEELITTDDIRSKV